MRRNLARLEGEAVDAEAEALRQQPKIVLAEFRIHQQFVGARRIDRDVGTSARVEADVAAGVFTRDGFAVLRDVNAIDAPRSSFITATTWIA